MILDFLYGYARSILKLYTRLLRIYYNAHIVKDGLSREVNFFTYPISNTFAAPLSPQNLYFKGISAEKTICLNFSAEHPYFRRFLAENF